MRSHKAPTVLAMVTAAVAALTLTAGQAAAQVPGNGYGPAIAHGTFGEYADDADDAVASTYDPALVPVGAHAGVLSMPKKGHGTFTAFAVSGLVPDREYGAHAHTRPCGPTGDDAGPHFQHVPDPNPPSTDPRYANPGNEIWLDFTTDARGNGFSVSQVDWTFGGRRPASVVIHEHHTSTEPGEAGSAGARLACLNVDF